MVVNGQIVIRPIMVVALTYDHRLMDGREAVTFLGTCAVPLQSSSSADPTWYSSCEGLYRRPPEDVVSIVARARV